MATWGRAKWTAVQWWGFRRGSEGLWRKGGICAGGVREVCEWGAFMWGGFLQGRDFGRSVYLRWALSSAPSYSYLPLYKIWTKSDNPQPNYSDLTYLNCHCPPSMIFEESIFGHSTCPHEMWWRYLDQRQRYAPKLEFEKTPPGGGIVHPVPTLTPSGFWGP